MNNLKGYISYSETMEWYVSPPPPVYPLECHCPDRIHLRDNAGAVVTTFTSFSNTAMENITFYLYDHLGNTRVTYYLRNCESTVTVENILDYDPYGKVLRSFSNDPSDKERYVTTHHERDKETGYDYRGARFYDSDIARFLSVDPMAAGRVSVTPYNYVQGNPIMRVDPTGALDGWIEDANGNVSWDASTNSQAKFNKNYKGREGYSYVSDSNNPNSYTLPSGAGKVVINQWEGFEVEDGLGGLSIGLEFIPKDPSAVVGWTQTFSSNDPDFNTGNMFQTFPKKNIVERLDGSNGVQKSTDLSKARYFDGRSENGTPMSTLEDTPARTFTEGSKSGVLFYAQSSVIMSGHSPVSLGWGFMVTSLNSQTLANPTILKNPTDFHKGAVQSLINKTK